MRAVVLLLFHRVTARAGGALGLGVLALALVGGCTEKAAVKGPEDVEKARQDHIQMMQRETGKAPASK